MTSPEWLERVKRIRVNVRAGVRAPYKPLLLLFALGRLHQAQNALINFQESERQLQQLIDEYGPPSSRGRAEYPFYHLKNDDGLWELHPPIRARSTSVSAGELRTANVSGQLTAGFADALMHEPGLFSAVVLHLLESNFPVSLHEDLCRSAGLDLETLELRSLSSRIPRSRQFRELVLMAYEYRCAICDYQGFLNGQIVGLDAAHVRWWAYGGADDVHNGLCLCTFHHKLLDLGVLSADPHMRVLVSQQFAAPNDQAHALVTRWSGIKIRDPQFGQPPVHPTSFYWHRKQVFRGPSRHLDVATRMRSTEMSPTSIAERRDQPSAPVRYDAPRYQDGILRRVAESRAELGESDLGDENE